MHENLFLVPYPRVNRLETDSPTYVLYDTKTNHILNQNFM